MDRRYILQILLVHFFFSFFVQPFLLEKTPVKWQDHDEAGGRLLAPILHRQKQKKNTQVGSIVGLTVHSRSDTCGMWPMLV